MKKVYIYMQLLLKRSNFESSTIFTIGNAKFSEMTLIKKELPVTVLAQVMMITEFF